MQTLVLTGPPACGKNTIASALAGTRDRCAVVDVDVVRHMIVQPHVAPWGGDEGRRQQQLGVRNTSLLARSLMTAGFDVIVCDVIDERTARLYRSELAEAALAIVRLLPSFEECQRRSRTRPSYLTPSEFEMLYRQQETLRDVDETIDNSRLNVDQVTDTLRRFMDGPK